MAAGLVQGMVPRLKKQSITRECLQCHPAHFREDKINLLGNLVGMIVGKRVGAEGEKVGSSVGKSVLDEKYLIK